ncbi:MAG TPA: serine/threonine-protein kinase [Polyangiaceae bacterium]|nr:serine/threonine-protein kinase [Polyangiaceae bacterium]
MHLVVASPGQFGRSPGTATAETSITPSGASQLSPGTIVAGRYVIRRMLGHGGAASVYAAEHVVVKRAVALKLPHVDVDMREMLFARLRRETKALAAVRHPVIVDVIDGGDTKGVPFLAMQLLEGRTLTGLLAARGSLDPDSVVKIGVQLASGLAAVHAAGIIHRDVKPANVIITREPSNQVRLVDFGVAKLPGAVDVVDHNLTQSGAILGTVEYMAPEALLGQPNVDFRADQYSLGVTLYECATGAVPFDGGLGQVLLRVATSEPTPLTSVRFDIPKVLSEVIHRCLARDPDKRYSSMAELSVALAACANRKLDTIDVLGDARGRVAPPLPPSRAKAQPGTPGSSTAMPAVTSAVAAPAVSTPAAAPPSSATALPQIPNLQVPQPPAPVAQPAPAAAAQPKPEARRQVARAPYVTLATLLRDPNSAPVDGRIEDISEGGVLVVANEACAQGDIVRLRFATPMTGRMIEISAVARWSRSSRGTRATGFEFQNLSDQTRAEIRQYVSLMTAKSG